MARTSGKLARTRTRLDSSGAKPAPVDDWPRGQAQNPLEWTTPGAKTALVGDSGIHARAFCAWGNPHEAILRLGAGGGNPALDAVLRRDIAYSMRLCLEYARPERSRPIENRRDAPQTESGLSKKPPLLGGTGADALRGCRIPLSESSMRARGTGVRACLGYLARASSTATAQATVQPTMGLLPMPIRPIMSTCAGTEEEPANWALECMRPMVSVMP